MFTVIFYFILNYVPTISHMYVGFVFIKVDPTLDSWTQLNFAKKSVLYKYKIVPILMVEFFN